MSSNTGLFMPWPRAGTEGECLTHFGQLADGWLVAFDLAMPCSALLNLFIYLFLLFSPVCFFPLDPLHPWDNNFCQSPHLLIECRGRLHLLRLINSWSHAECRACLLLFHLALFDGIINISNHQISIHRKNWGIWKDPFRESFATSISFNSWLVFRWLRL